MENGKPQPIDYAAVLADLKAKRADLDKAIAVIEPLVTGVASALVVEGSNGQSSAQPAAPTGINEHSFFGMSIAKAAETYLTIKKKPASAIEMAGALVDGGFPSQSDNFSSTITTALYRQKDVFVRVKRGLWGLKAWYPNYRKPD